MKRYDCLRLLAGDIPEDALAVMGVGLVSREWHSLRPHEANLYQLNLGCCTPVAAGLAVALPQRRVIALDGDGNLLLNLASLADVANSNPSNLVIFVFDNENYESGGGLPTVTVSGRVDLALAARGLGFKNSVLVRTVEEFAAEARAALKRGELSLVVAKVELGTVASLPALHQDGKETKYRFARYIERTEGKRILIPQDRPRASKPWLKEG